MKSKISINLDKIIARINPNLYGHFAEHLGKCIYEGFWVGEDSHIPNKNGIRTDVVEALKKINPSILRWPGGCFADDYHWEHGIGPRKSRPIRVNRWWNREESNQFGTHEFLELCHQLECEPYICGNVGSGTVQEMSDWLEYLNYEGSSTLAKLRQKNGHPQAFKVHYWGVGNENWGCGGHMSPGYYANEYRRYSTYCSSYNPEKPLYLIACGANGFDFEWTKRFFETISGKKCSCGSRLNMVNGYSIHYYCGTAGTATEYTEAEWYHLIMKALAMEELIEEHRAIIDQYSNNVDLICDEWGTWHPVLEGTDPGWLLQQNTVRDALIAAITLDIFNNNADKISMANIAQTMNVLQAMGLTNGEKLILTPTYHVYEMYVPHQNGDALTIEIDSPEVSELSLPMVLGAASIKKEILTLSLVNIHVCDLAEIDLNFISPEGKTPKLTSWRILTSADIHDHNTFEEPNKVIPTEGDLSSGIIVLPPASVNVVQFHLE